MDMICRIAKKIRLSDNLFTLKKLGLEVGVIDTEGNFKVMDEQTGEIKKYPLYSDPEFLGSENELCYCDERSRDGILSTIENVSTKAELFQKYKEMTDSNVYIIEYDKESQTSQPLFLNSYRYSQLVELKDALEELRGKNLYESDKKCFTYFKDGILTTNKTIKNLKNLIENDKAEEAIEILETVIVDYNTANCIEEEEDLGVEAAIRVIQEMEKEKQEANQEENASDQSERSLDEVMNDVNSLVGLENVKYYADQLFKFLLFLKNPKRENAKIKLNMGVPNLCFLGNPGTGKTTVAKLFSEILNKLGYANGKFKEVKATDFIAEYVGQTGPKTEKLLKEIRGGVLFLDEAYSLLSGNSEKSSSFGQEALAVLLKEMDRKDTIFIFAGYKKEMKAFLEGNSGLESRIGKNIEFRDYTIEELYQMFTKKIKDANFKLTPEAGKLVIELISQAITEKNFGNGRYIDNLFESIIMEHGKNVYNSKNVKVLQTITTQDIDAEKNDKILYKKLEGNKIGF